MTKYTKRFVIVVTEEQQTASNLQAKKVDKGQKPIDKTWKEGLSPTGKGAPTHYWCSWQMRPDETVELKKFLEEIPGHNEQVFELDHWDPQKARPTPEEILKTTNLKVIHIDDTVITP